jgi:hypothetical protein
VFRDGGSEYFINDRAGWDIQQLFMGTGGPDQQHMAQGNTADFSANRKIAG